MIQFELRRMRNYRYMMYEHSYMYSLREKVVSFRHSEKFKSEEKLFFKFLFKLQCYAKHSINSILYFYLVKKTLKTVECFSFRLIFFGFSRRILFQGTNGTFRMFIEGDDGIFDVTPSRGINEAPFLIRVKNSSKLDFETRSGKLRTYSKLKFDLQRCDNLAMILAVNFTLIAKEVVTLAPKLSKVPVVVFIKDQNDNYPEFTEDKYEVSIPENCAVGTTVAWVQALDEDSGNFGTLGIRYTNLGGSIAHA